MARGRFISNEITLDRQVAELSSDTCRLAYTWAITYADREGRIVGEPLLLMALLFPRRKGLKEKDVESWIKEWAEAGFIIWYLGADGDRVIQFINFEKHQKGLRKDREPESNLCPPEESRIIAGSLPDDFPLKLMLSQSNDNSNDNEIKGEDKVNQSPHSLALTDENGELAPEEDRIIEIFCDRVGLTGNNRPYENDPSNRKWYADWLREAGEIQKLGISSGEMGEAIAILKASGYSCKHPGAIIETVKNMRKDREAFEKGEKKKLHRYKLEKYTDAIGNCNYQPIDWWEEK